MKEDISYQSETNSQTKSKTISPELTDSSEWFMENRVPGSWVPGLKKRNLLRVAFESGKGVKLKMVKWC